jgi:spore coat polysaccharide biosynthesis protein SpsF (cytidylyltransferase family)
MPKAMKIIAAVPVRMSSSRLPGKVLTEVAGKPLLGHLLDRLSRSRRLDGVVVATSIQPENDEIEAYCSSRGTSCYRGDENDVLSRLLGAYEDAGATVGVEIFGDCPLVDPLIVDSMIERYLSADPQFDFVGNDLTTTWPPGFEVEVFSIKALVDAAAACGDLAFREHGTLFIRQNPKRYRLCNVEAPAVFRRPELELEVDTIEDLNVMKAILIHFRDNPAFGLAEVIAFLDSGPRIAASNQSVARRWKEFRQRN